MDEFEEAKSKITFACRFHPTDWFHEVGCPHMEWTNEQLQSAIESHKASLLVLQERLYGKPGVYFQDKN